MANRRRRKFHRVPEAINEAVTPQGIFISNEYKHKIAIVMIIIALILFCKGLLVGSMLKRR